MAEAEKLNIYVLNWNQADLTIDCVKSLLNQSIPVDTEIFIIDNGSEDDSLEIFNRTFPNIEVLENTKNLGFQGGMNKGIRHSLEKKVDYVMLLNNDTFAGDSMFETLFAKFPSDAVLVSPGIYYYKDPDLLCSLGGNINPLFLEVLGKPNTFYTPPETVNKFDFLPSHAWLIRTEIFSDVGVFDEDYFPIYYDDLDFCLRLKRHGFSIYLIPQAKIYHRISLSMGGRNSPNERYIMARNGGYYFRKNMNFLQIPFVISYRFCSSVLWTIRLLYQKNFKALESYWKGIFDGWFKPLPR